MKFTRSNKRKQNIGTPEANINKDIEANRFYPALSYTNPYKIGGRLFPIMPLKEPWKDEPLVF